MTAGSRIRLEYVRSAAPAWLAPRPAAAGLWRRLGSSSMGDVAPGRRRSCATPGGDDDIFLGTPDRENDASAPSVRRRLSTKARGATAQLFGDTTSTKNSITLKTQPGDAELHLGEDGSNWDRAVELDG